MQAIEVIFGYDPEEGHNEQQRKLKKLLDFIMERRWIRSYAVFEAYDEKMQEFVPHITVKWDRCEEIKDLFSWRDKSVECKIYHVCMHPNCYKTVAAKFADVALFDRGGECEPLHEIHDHCTLHLQEPHSRQISRTLQLTNDTLGQKLWTKILSFQIDKEFYAQRIDLVNEGDYEMGEQLVDYPTPWVGPCKDRTAAIEVAREWEAK